MSANIPVNINPNKNDIVNKSKEFALVVELFILSYDKEMNAPSSFDRGSKIATIINKLQTALVMMKLEFEFYDRKVKVKDFIYEHYENLDGDGI